MSLKLYVLTILLILAFLVPGVYGDIHVGVSGGSGSGSRGSVGFGIGANKDATVTGCIAANGASLYPTLTISGIGDLDENHQVTDSAQNHAEIHAKVVDGLNIQYSDTLTPGAGNLGSTTGAVEADQTLTVGDSKFIKCSQSASNLEGDKASAGIEIEHGSLTNYQGHALAGLSSAKAYQSFEAASGREIKLYSLSFNAEKDNAKTWIEVDGTKGNLGNITNFADRAYASATNANASQTFKTAIGNKIELGVLSSNKEKDNADVSMEIKKGAVSNFTSQAYASATNATSSGTFNNATGNEIKLGTSSSNKEKDNADVSMEIKKGAVSNFTAKADTTLVNASASLVNSSASSLISGKSLVFEAKASDSLGYRVRAITKVKNGTLTGGVADIAFVDSPTNTLKASQSASTLEGTSLDADGKASNVTGITVHKSSNIDNPSISDYQNSASVIAGTPSVIQP